MVKTILFSVVVIFFVCGLCDFIYIIKMFFIRPARRVTNYTLIVLQRNYSVEQLNYIYQNMRWNGANFSSGIIALTDMLEQSEIELCNKYIEHKKIFLCNSKYILECEYIKGGLFNE